MHLERLSAITRSLLNSKSPDEYVSSAKDLSRFYKDITVNIAHSAMNEAVVGGGVALSSLGAADCVDDYLRTTFFIKGVYTALTKLLGDKSGGPVNILYAGCGPYATLLLPLLPLFSSDAIRAIVLDINKPSLDCVQNIIDAAGLKAYDLKLECADATTYTKPDDFVIDLCISETMHYALTREPQVAIIKNLAPQLSDHSVLIPKQISIDLAFSSYSKEPFLKDGNTIEASSTPLYPLRIPLGRLFTIDKNHFPDTECSKFESGFYKVPKDFAAFPDICLYTEVLIIEGISLKNAASYITNPYCAGSLWNFRESESVRLTYEFSEIPRWSCDPGPAYGLDG